MYELCTIGVRINAARERAGIPQEVLSAAMEMGLTHISFFDGVDDTICMESASSIIKFDKQEKSYQLLEMNKFLIADKIYCTL